MIKISIIIPVYNIEEYIAACLDSVIGQDFDDFEVIVVDDGSTDNSGKICDGYARDNVRIYHKENGGLSDARNFGFSKARGKYILFVDGDDTITHNACSELYAEAEKNDADTVIGTAILARASAAAARYERIARDNFSLHTPYTGKEYLTVCLKGGALRVEVWRTLYRRNFLVENNLLFKKGIMHEDEEFTPRALLAAKSVVLTDLAFYRYNNDRANSIINSTAKNAKKATDSVSIYLGLLEIYKSVTPRKLRRLLEDDAAQKYAHCFSVYGLNVIKPRRFLPLKYAYTAKRRIKAIVFAICPRFFVKHFK